MIFQLDCTKYFFTEEEKNQYEKMGFLFEIHDEENPVLKYKKNTKHLPTIVIYDIEALKKWAETHIKCELIISFNPNEIEIYDDYRE